MKRKFITIALALLVAAAAVFASGVVHAQRGPDGRHGFGGPRFGRGFAGGGGPFASLNLSQEQRDQVRAIFERHRPEFEAAGQKMEAARSAQRAAIDAVPFDEAEIRARTADVGNVEADMAVLRARVHSEVFQILTPDQQTKFKERAGRGRKDRDRK
jgi:protein CpxP